MKIRRFEVSGLFGRYEIDFERLHDDLNVITGRNGAGKTSILKLLWYIISGNLALATREVVFQKATVETDLYSCTVWRINPSTCRVELTTDGRTETYEDQEDYEGDVIVNAEDQANPELIRRGSSVFFPTFRRIEGGFSLALPPRLSVRNARAKGDVEEALFALSRKLTNNPHIFVSSISTTDIVELLLNRYTDMSENSNALQQRVSMEIIEKIKAFKRDERQQIEPAEQKFDAANELIDDIRGRIEAMEVQRAQILTPLTAVETLVTKLFRHAGIAIGRRITFGEAANAIHSDALSAGEKQMLSFICYNAFYSDAVFLIDEPELSLHVDWQRQLFAILKEQGSSNQFIIATHSPFIYSKFPDKELCIDEDRGDEESDAS